MILYFWILWSPFRENGNVVIVPFPFHICMPLANLWLIRLQGQFPIRRTSSHDLYPLIRPPKRPLALGRGRMFMPGFVRSPPTLAVYNVAHSLPRGGVGRGFPFTEYKTRRHFTISLVYKHKQNLFAYPWSHLFKSLDALLFLQDIKLNFWLREPQSTRFFATA